MIAPTFSFARRHGLLLLDGEGPRPRYACREDISAAILTELTRVCETPPELEWLDHERFDQLLQRQFEGGEQPLAQAGDVAEQAGDLQQLARELPEPADLLESDNDAPIIRLINAMFAQAVRENASDIHIEPYENRLAIRFRVDGVLREVLAPHRSLAPLIISRIKVMAELDIAEKRLPQDGRISLRLAGRPVDVRVSTLPSGHGERVVLRLLDKQAGRLELGQLGMPAAILERWEQLIQRPHGIILVTGPTGSGKTTTLYAALNRLNDRKRNILTVEDPIEYYIDGIGQTQVNSKVDMSFARGLRAILRQDPDIVMVGEIRDLETAQVAVQASLTGHLVLSTLHTNSAIATVVRLRDMGIEPFLLASSLAGVLSQRLVRKLCNHCKTPWQPDADYLAGLGLPTEPVTLYRAGGCDHCRQSGYQGRTGLYELLAMDEALQQAIHRQASENELAQLARKTGHQSLFQAGWQRVAEGVTSLDEVLRVSREEPRHAGL